MLQHKIKKTEKCDKTVKENSHCLLLFHWLYCHQ